MRTYHGVAIAYPALVKQDRFEDGFTPVQVVFPQTFRAFEGKDAGAFGKACRGLRCCPCIEMKSFFHEEPVSSRHEHYKLKRLQWKITRDVGLCQATERNVLFHPKRRPQ